MKNRIKELRKVLNLNQTEFGSKIGVKQGSVAGYESGARIPIDAVITSICREFGVNEQWLRTGEGEMFHPRTRNDEIAAFIGGILSGDPRDEFKRRLISALSRLDVGAWEVLEQLANSMAAENKKEEQDP